MGFTFKENCPDTRNTKVLEICKILKKYKVEIDIVDPWIEKSSILENQNIQISSEINQSKKYKAVICAVAHKEFYDIRVDEWKSLLDENGILLI